MTFGIESRRQHGMAQRQKCMPRTGLADILRLVWISAVHADDIMKERSQCR